MVSIEDCMNALLGEFELLYDSGDDAYACKPGKSTVWPIRTEVFRRRVMALIHNKLGHWITKGMARHLVDILQLLAADDDVLVVPSLRSHWSEKCVVIDLANDDDEVVVIDENGWLVTTFSPVKFIRHPSMQPLPAPAQEGNLHALRPFVNLEGEEDYALLVAWIIGTFGPGPFPLLALTGDPGSAKSTLSTILRKLVDPATPPTAAFPKSEEDLVVAAQANRALVFDNLARLSRGSSDALCRLATGSGFLRRRRYTDCDLIALDASRPCVVNSIEGVITASDLLDRALVIHAKPLNDGGWWAREELWAEFDRQHSNIFGGICDAISIAIRNLSSISATGLPRMADFARWVYAAEPALGLEKSMKDVLKSNECQRDNTAVCACVVGSAILSMASTPGFSCRETITGLVARIEAHHGKLPHGFPRQPEAVSKRLRRLRKSLERLGIVVKFDGQRSQGQRWVEISNSATPDLESLL